MELRKTLETVNRAYSDGTQSEVVTNINYEVVDSGQVVGSACVYSGGYSLSINKSGDLEAMRAELEAMFAIQGGVI